MRNGRRERIEKGSRERIEKERMRKRQTGVERLFEEEEGLKETISHGQVTQCHVDGDLTTSHICPDKSLSTKS